MNRISMDYIIIHRMPDILYKQEKKKKEVQKSKVREVRPWDWAVSKRDREFWNSMANYIFVLPIAHSITRQFFPGSDPKI